MVQRVFEKVIKSMQQRVEIVSCCIHCQRVIYVLLFIELSVSGECCIRYYTVVSLAIGKENTYRLSKYCMSRQYYILVPSHSC